MTPEQKAKELVDKFKYNLWENSCYNAKQCALIAIEFAINYSDFHIEYLQQTKTEIEKL